jgi:hypothetical protein
MRACLFRIRVPFGFVAALFVAGELRADWPQWRGPGGQGISDATGVPLTWSETNNIRWKASIPASGIPRR